MPKNLKILLLPFLALAIPLILVLVFSLSQNKHTAPKAPTAVLVGKTIALELADTPEKQQQGLMYRASLGENEGMLFVFDIENYYTFWMRNMNFPLDIIWIDNVDGQLMVVDIKRDAKPCYTTKCEQYIPERPADYVLELNSGWTLKNKVNVGETLELNLAQ
jgi:uncharacterized protein